METPDHYLEINRELWNAKTAYHIQSDFYDVAGFMAGKSSLKPVDLELLGNVAGQTILHLQCHFGLDTLSLSRLGAQATGVDLSDEAVAKARELAGQLGLDTRFICCNVYDLPQHLDEQFDVVFTTYGVLGWLPDLEQWAALVNRYLKPGGRLVLAEFHPVVWMFDSGFTQVQYSYFNKETIVETESGTYADREAPIVHSSVSWNHSLSEVLGSLLHNGLTIKQFEEHDYSAYNCFAHTEQVGEDQYRIQHLPGKLPMMYSVVAVK